MSKPPSHRSGRKERQRIWEYKGQWLSRVPGSPNFYRNYYAGDRRVGRASLGTADLDEAKTLLVREVEGDVPKDPLSPDQVYFAAIAKHYMDAHGNHIRSKNAAKRAFDLVLEYLKSATGKKAPTVADFGLARQEAFMRWCRDEHKLSSKSIYTYLSTIRAAMNFCATPRIVRDSMGQEREARILSVPFHISNKQSEVCRITSLPQPQPRQFVPSDQEMARLLEATYDENDENSVRDREQLFRFCIIAMNTWARPEAIFDLNVAKQVDFANGLIHLNPTGRRQTRKYRPTVRLTDTLRGWLLHWNLERPIVYLGQPVKEVSAKTFKKIAIEAGVPEMVRYSLRHYMNTRSMRVPADIRPDREERAIWMGHRDDRHRTTMTYEHFDPEYLTRGAAATDAIMLTLDKLTRKSLLAPSTVRPGLHVIEKRA
jgi:integrase